MRSSFFELNVAASGLFVARGNLDTVAHNVSNAQTAGYSRQVTEQRASRPLTYYDGRGMVGTGAEIYGVKQIRSFYLDKRYWSESHVLGDYSTKKSQLDVMEKTFNEMSTTGLSAQFDDFFDILEDLTTTPGDQTYRTNLLTSAASINTFFSNTYETLKKQQTDINSEVKVVVDSINSLGIQISSLNDLISTFELDGSVANDLRDQRARLVDELSQYVNIEVREIETNADYAAGKYPEPEDRSKSRKEFVVLINGSEFVNHEYVNQLECRPRTLEDTANNKIISFQRNAEDNAGMYDIYWTQTNAQFNIYHQNLSGQLKGLIDIRDGNNSNFARNVTVVTDNNATNIVELELDDDYKLELPSSGRITLKDKVTGLTSTVDYTDLVHDPATNKVTMRLVQTDAPSLANLTLAGKDITIGETTNYKGITYYMSKLNDLVRTYVTAVNTGKYMDDTNISNVTGHVDAYDQFGNKTNKLLYTYIDKDGKEYQYNDPNFNILNFRADNVLINSDIESDNRLFGAAEQSVGSGGISDNRAALSFLNIRTNDSLFLEGNILDYINGMTGELAIDNSQATKFESNYTDVVTGLDNQRISVSGVSLNEEMVKMIKYQQQYQACAKLMNVIDGIYDTTVNRLGL